jgi:hypothetical protein
VRGRSHESKWAFAVDFYLFRALLVLDAVLFVVDRRLLPPLRTVLPLRPSLRNFPAAMSCSYAPRTTLRATFRLFARSRSLGRNVPTAKVPASIKEFSCSRICLVIDSGRLRLTRTLSFTFVAPHQGSLCSATGVSSCQGWVDSKQHYFECQTTYLSTRKRLDHRDLVVKEIHWLDINRPCLRSSSMVRSKGNASTVCPFPEVVVALNREL